MFRWFHNLKTMAKLMLGFALVGAIMGVVGYVGISGMGAINDSVDNINNVQLKPLMTLTRVRGLVYQMRASTITALLTPNAADREEALARVRELNKLVDETKDSFVKTIKSDLVQKSYEDFTKAYDDYRSYRDNTVFKLLLAGDHTGALAAMKGDGAVKFKASIDAINNLVDTKVKIAQGKYESAVKTYEDSKTTLITVIVIGIALGLFLGWVIARILASGLSQVATVTQSAAQGDLTQRVHITSSDELGAMATSFNAMLESLTKIVSEVREGTGSITSAAAQISVGVQDLSQRTSEQASALEETSASMEEMTSTVKQNADNAKQANQLGNAARDVAEQGGAVVAKAVLSMDEINKSSKKIADIITVIDEIAFQTNLLALNAAVEAARAGEHGRGFAVVAAEVRNLAQRSASAAKEIKGLINESVQKVSDGSELVNQSGKRLEEIVSSVKRVTDILAEITAASQEQATGIDQVNKAVMQMDETTQQNAALVEESAAAAEGMQQQTTHLQQLVSVFKVDSHGTGFTAQPSPPKHAQTGGGLPGKKVLAKNGKPTSSAHKPAKDSHSVSSPSDQLEPVGVSNGHDRRRQHDDFEEF